MGLKKEIFFVILNTIFLVNFLSVKSGTKIEINLKEPISQRMEEYLNIASQEQSERAKNLSATVTSVTLEIEKIIEIYAPNLHEPCDDEQAILEEIKKCTNEGKNPRDWKIEAMGILKNCYEQKKVKEEEIDKRWIKNNKQMLIKLFRLMSEKELNWLYFDPGKMSPLLLFTEPQPDLIEIKPPYREFLLIKIDDYFAVVFNGLEWALCKRGVFKQEKDYCINEYSHLFSVEGKKCHLLTVSFFLEENKYRLLELGRFYFDKEKKHFFDGKELLTTFINFAFKKGYYLNIDNEEIQIDTIKN